MNGLIIVLLMVALPFILVWIERKSDFPARKNIRPAQYAPGSKNLRVKK